MLPLLVRRLRGLNETSVRLGWFSSWIGSTATAECAQELERLLDCCESFHDRATTSLVTVVSWTSGAVDPCRLHALGAESRAQGLFRTSRMLQHAADCPVRLDQEPNGPIPDYVRGRIFTLGERKALARQPHRRALEKLLLDPHPAVIEQLLGNPRLTERDLVKLVTLRPPHAASLCHLFRDGRWLTSPRVRMGLLLNPGVPLWQSVPLLSLCARQDLHQMATSQHIPRSLASLACSHFNRHPPLQPAANSPGLH